jgi:hypothetical protein
VSRCFSISILLVASVGIAGLPPAAGAGIPGGVAIVLGFHIRAIEDSLAIPLPPSPIDLLPQASPEPGLYDVWLFLHTRAPLIGAWSMSFALEYDGAEGSGVDVLEARQFLDDFRPSPGWPGSGCGMYARWDRIRCQEPHRYMIQGSGGWWVQPALRLLVHGPDRIGLTSPEPGVRPQLIECADEEHALDGSEGWTLVLPAVFGHSSRPPQAAVTSSQETTWGALKARAGGSR